MLTKVAPIETSMVTGWHSLRVAGVKTHAIKAPKISVTETANHSFKVQGTVTSKAKIHSVIVLDSPLGFGDYWTRSYCARIGDTGEFSVDVNDIFDSPKGKLMIFFCLDNGLNSASGQREVGRTDFIEFSYEGAANERKFTRELHPSKPERRSRPRPSSGGRPDRKREWHVPVFVLCKFIFPTPCYVVGVVTYPGIL